MWLSEVRTEEARLIKGHLLGCPKGTEPTIEQINKSALFTLRPPSKEYKDEAQEEEEEIDLREIANIHHLWDASFPKVGCFGQLCTFPMAASGRLA